jgi:hypothetical protein
MHFRQLCFVFLPFAALAAALLFGAAATGAVNSPILYRARPESVVAATIHARAIHAWIMRPRRPGRITLTLGFAAVRVDKDASLPKVADRLGCCEPYAYSGPSRDLAPKLTSRRRILPGITRDAITLPQATAEMISVSAWYPSALAATVGALGTINLIRLRARTRAALSSAQSTPPTNTTSRRCP